VQISFSWRFLTATALIILPTLAFPQEGTLRDWLIVHPGEADLVLLIDGHFTAINLSTEYPPNPPKPYASWKWSPSFPAFVAKFQVEPREYQFGLLQGPISGIGVITKVDTQVFLHLSPLGDKNGVPQNQTRDPSKAAAPQERDVGAAVTVTQGPAGNILAILNDLEQSGYKFNETPTPLKFAGKFLIDTTPPWPIPPPPKK
jgi:hypothetical protein